MKILLDTHIFLWFISGDSRLSTDVRDIIRDLDNEIYLSVVFATSLGKTNLRSLLITLTRAMLSSVRQKN